MVFKFAQTAGERLSGPPAYLDNICRMFSQDENGGMIEVEVREEEQWVLLYQAGKQFAAYRITPEQALPIEPDSLIFSNFQEYRFRYLVMPDHVLRAIWQALEWFPPDRAAQLDLQMIGTYLDALRVQQTRALVQLILPDRDGFILLIDGSPVSAEGIFASNRGFEDMMPNLHSALQGSGECEVWLTDLRPETLTGQLLNIRLGMGAWITSLINGYRQMVGSSLITPLDYDTNTWLRRHHYNMRLVNAAVVDHHLFLNLPMAVDAYNSLMNFITSHIAQVIGDRLAVMKRHESYRNLKSDQQKSLVRLALAPQVEL